MFLNQMRAYEIWFQPIRITEIIGGKYFLNRSWNGQETRFNSCSFTKIYEPIEEERNLMSTNQNNRNYR